jgi:sugar phosphate isomerase/epimerase
MRKILDDNGMKYVELEFLTDWFLEGARKSESDSRKHRLFEASEILHAKHIKVGDFYNSACPFPKIVESFAALCSEAANYGATIGFEIMGSAMIDNLQDAVAMVKMAGAKNGGIIIDSYQVANLGLTYQDISSIPVEHLIGVELNDGILPGNPGYDPSNRRFCGEGEYDLKGLLDCVKNMGYSGPWGVEVIAENLAVLPLRELSTRAYTTTMAQLADF